jgi:hypothetical protein
VTEEIELAGLSLEAQADLLLMRDAKRRGQSYVEYCYTQGLTGPAQRRRVRRHESNNFNGLLYAEAPEGQGDE